MIKQWIGIDPGQSGGIAWIIHSTWDKSTTAGACKIPATDHDTWSTIKALSTEGNRGVESFAVLEKVHSMPKQGVASTFKFGTSYGMLRAFLIASEIPFEEVTPNKWQRAMSCQTGGDKNVTKAKAQEMFPHIKMTHAIADALLIADYCRRHHG
jgi:crossover junction endodeoxyribonuclease RuvC